MISIFEKPDTVWQGLVFAIAAAIQWFFLGCLFSRRWRPPVWVCVVAIVFAMLLGWLRRYVI